MKPLELAFALERQLFPHEGCAHCQVLREAAFELRRLAQMEVVLEEYGVHHAEGCSEYYSECDCGAAELAALSPKKRSEPHKVSGPSTDEEIEESDNLVIKENARKGKTNV